MDEPQMRLLEQGDCDQALVLIPGLWTEDSGCDKRWIESLRTAGFKGSIYDFAWDSSSETTVFKGLIRGAMTAAAGAGGDPVALLASSRRAYRAVNYWRKMKKRAKKSGRDFLPNMLKQNIRESNVTVLGHSLGARVAYYGIMEGAQINRLITAGGAIRRDSSKDWPAASNRIPGGIFNIWNREDKVLKYLFRTLEFRNSPIGRKPIKAEHPRIFQIDVTDSMKEMGRTGWKNSHTHYFRVLPELQLFR